MSILNYIDTHCHLDGEEFKDDLNTVIQRAREAGCVKVFVPAIDLPSCQIVMDVCNRFPDYAYPMLGLHPEEVKADWREVLSKIKQKLPFLQERAGGEASLLAIGEVGLDFYWSREFEKEQLEAFEEQVRWSVETRLPLMIHCRKAQNEMVSILKRCFTGNETEARQLLEFDNFVLGIGGVLTFKKSHLPEVLPAVVPLDRIVLETDAPYMAPVPMRGNRNEPAFIRHIITRLAEAYGVSEETICEKTNSSVERIFGLKA